MTTPLDPREPPRPLPRPIPVSPPGAIAPRPRQPLPEKPPGPLSPQTKLAMAIIAGTTAAVVLAMCGGVFALAYSLASQRQAVAKRSDATLSPRTVTSRRQAGRAVRDTSGGDADASRTVRRNPPPASDPDAALPPYERHRKWLGEYDSQKIRTAAQWFAEQPRDEQQQAEVETALLESLRRGDRGSRAASCDALHVWGDESIIPELATFAKRYRYDAAPAIHLLATFNTAEATTALVELLKEPAPVGTAAAEALQQRPDELKPRLAALLVDRDRRSRQAAANLIASLQVADDEIATAMRAELSSDEADRRRGALEWFAQAKVSDEHRHAIQAALTQLLSDSNHGVPEAAMKALIADRSPGSNDALLQAIDAEVEPWALALPELFERGDERLVPRLEKLLKNPQTSGRCMVATRKVTEGEPIIRKLLQTSEDRTALRNTLLFFKHLMNRETLPALQELQRRTVAETDPAVRGFAQAAIDHVNALPRE